jgi:hypothetical protein
MPCKSTVSLGVKNTVINYVAASCHQARASLRSLSPGRPARCLVTPSTSLACYTATVRENAVFGTPCSELRRLKLISARPSPEPLETFMIEIAISCDMSQRLDANEFRPETKTRTRSAISAKPESENRQRVGRRSAKKQGPPHGQKTYRLAQTKPTVSTQSGGGPSEILFSCHFRLAPKLGRRSPIAKFTYCRHSRKILARPSERRASKKMNQLGPSKSPLGRTRGPRRRPARNCSCSLVHSKRPSESRTLELFDAIQNARFRWTTRIHRPADVSVPEPITIAKVNSLRCEPCR